MRSTMRWRLANDMRELRDFRRALTSCLEMHADSDSDVHGAVLAASEIVTNAISYSDDVVDVVVEWDGEATVLSVTDLGPGFDLDKVRQPEPHEATGRGLMIVSKIVDHLAVDANEPQGSIVRAHLPVRPRVEALDGACGSPLIEDRAAPGNQSELSRFQLRPQSQYSLGRGGALRGMSGA